MLTLFVSDEYSFYQVGGEEEVWIDSKKSWNLRLHTLNLLDISFGRDWLLQLAYKTRTHIKFGKKNIVQLPTEPYPSDLPATWKVVGM